MKKIAAKYPVEGTSALKLEAMKPNSQMATIIAFPGCEHQDDFNGAPSFKTGRQTSIYTTFQALENRALQSEMVSSLREGDSKGIAFGHMQRWQAILGGSILTALAFASLFFSL